MTEYQAGLLLHRLNTFDRAQAVRQKNFIYLRNLMGNVRCLVPLTYMTVSTNGMSMFAMRYKQQHCGGLSLDIFLSSSKPKVRRSTVLLLQPCPTSQRSRIRWKNANIFDGCLPQ